MRVLLITFSFLCASLLAPAQPAPILKAKKSKSNDRYGYVNEGARSGWWAYTVATGHNVDELQCLGEHEWVIDAYYTTVADKFGESLAGVELNGKVGFIDAANRFVIAPQFEPCDKLYGFSRGLAPVKVNGKYGYIDKKGHMVIEPQFEEAGPFTENYVATVRMDKKYGAIDITGKVVVPCRYLTEEAMRFVPVRNKEYNAAAAQAKADAEGGGSAARRRSIDETAAAVNADIENALWRPAAPKVQVVAGSGGLYGLKAARTDTAWVVQADYTSIKALTNGFYLTTDSKGLFGIVDAWGRGHHRCSNNNVRYYPQSRCFVLTATMNDNARRDRIMTEGGKIVMPFVLDRIGDFKGGKADCDMAGLSGTVTPDGIVNDELVANLLDKAQGMEDKAAASLYYRILTLRPTTAEAQCNYALYDLSLSNNKEGMSRLKVAHDLAPDNQEIAACLKEARSDRRKRRWNRVGKALAITGTVAMTTATTYSAVKGIQSGAGGTVPAMGGTTPVSGTAGTADAGSSTSRTGTPKTPQTGKCKLCMGSGTCSPKNYSKRKDACHGSGLCGYCNGTGWIKAGSSEAVCKVCDGKGKCRSCKGTGKCPACQGKGH